MSCRACRPMPRPRSPRWLGAGRDFPADDVRDHLGITGPISVVSAETRRWNLAVTRGDAEKGVCPRGDLNPHALLRALAPQASASTYSATRTCGLLLAGRPRTIATGMVPPKGSNRPTTAGQFHKPR
jgi:hypothetical protein